MSKDIIAVGPRVMSLDVPRNVYTNTPINAAYRPYCKKYNRKWHHQLPTANEYRDEVKFPNRWDKTKTRNRLLTQKFNNQSHVFKLKEMVYHLTFGFIIIAWAKEMHKKLHKMFIQLNIDRVVDLCATGLEYEFPKDHWWR